MKTIRVTVIKDHIYDQIPRQVGQVYEAQSHDLHVLVGAGFVSAEQITEAPKPAGAYNRRDMRAQK